MKFSLKSASIVSGKYGTGVDPATYDVSELVSRMGLQLGAIEDVKNIGEKYEGLLVVKVVECDKHPNADKLSVCLVDDGGVTQHVERNNDGLIQVVCGAPNVRAGMLAAWIPPEATVPSTLDTDPFVLEARELRGKVSNGMLASSKELGISDDHEGILEINPADVGDKFAKPGTAFKQLYGLDDVVIDCENKMFTHRPDCFGTLGIAREVAGIFGDSYSSPEWYKNAIMHEKESELKLNAQNNAPDLVPRFTVQAMSEVEVKDSPLWLKSFLSRVESNSINNIVDYTNFFMLETAQPLHAFDYDKVAKLSAEVPTIQARKANKGEKIELLNGKTIELHEDDIVIATDKKPIALAGVMGGSETEVDDTTKNIIIECANFDMYAVRRTSMRHGLFTDAVTRFNKGQSPLQNDKVLAKILDEIKKQAGGKVATDVFDICSFDLSADNLNHVEVSADFINSRLGTELKPEEIKRLLENVEFTITLQGPTLQITAPFWRMDISIAEDIVEEVGRLYGYEKIPVILPPSISAPTPRNELKDYKNKLRSTLSKLGASEVLTYSFVHGDLLAKSNIDADKWAYHLRNALSPDLQYYRPALIPSLLSKVHQNIKSLAGDADNIFALFEIGKVHVKGEMEKDEKELPKQMRRLTLVVAADDKSAKDLKGSPYYHAKKYLDAITDNQASYTLLEDFSFPITASYKKNRSATVSVGGQALGVIGEINSKTAKLLKLPKYCAAFEVDIDLLSSSLVGTSYKQMSGFPSSKQDITFEVASDVNWSTLSSFIDAELAVAAAEDSLDVSLSPLDIYSEEKSDKKRISFRVELVSKQKTLKTTEVNNLLDHVSKAAHEKLKAVRI